MLYRGVVCERGQAYVDLCSPLLFACFGDDGQTTRVHGTVTIQHDAEDENHNPDISGLRVFLDTPPSASRVEIESSGDSEVTTGAPWPFVPEAELPPDDACLGTAPRCDVDAVDQNGLLCDYAINKFTIRLQYDPKLREKADGEYEDIEFSVFATDGELERRFVVFEREMELVQVTRPIACRTDDDCAGHTNATCHALRCKTEVKRTSGRVDLVQVLEDAEVLQGSVDWDVPEELRSRSQLVRFFFTVLDRRGGFTVTSRALCLTN
jgi:hypothetical protein